MSSPFSQGFVLSQNTPHRLPTLSVSQILALRRAPTAQPLSTGLPSLDDALFLQSNPRESSLPSSYRPAGAGPVKKGVTRGKVTLAFGPPGSGKTTFCLQLASDALKAGGSVLWIDCGNLLFLPRLSDILARGEDANDEFDIDSHLSRFRHIRAPHLAHILALLLHTSTSVFSTYSLVVLESLSVPIDSLYNTQPGAASSSSHYSPSRPSPGTNSPLASKPRPFVGTAASRQSAVISKLSEALKRISELHHLATVITCPMGNRIPHEGAPSVLYPSLNGPEWDACISTRILLLRDWIRGDVSAVGTDQESQEVQEDPLRHQDISRALQLQSRFVALLRPVVKLQPVNTVNRSGNRLFANPQALPLLPLDGRISDGDFMDPQVNIGPSKLSSSSMVVACFPFAIRKDGLIELQASDPKTTGQGSAHSECRDEVRENGVKMEEDPEVLPVSRSALVEGATTPMPNRTGSTISRSWSSLLPENPFSSSPEGLRELEEEHYGGMPEGSSDIRDSESMMLQDGALSDSNSEKAGKKHGIIGLSSQEDHSATASLMHSSQTQTPLPPSRPLLPVDTCTDNSSQSVRETSAEPSSPPLTPVHPSTDPPITASTLDVPLIPYDSSVPLSSPVSSLSSVSTVFDPADEPPPPPSGERNVMNEGAVLDEGDDREKEIHHQSSGSTCIQSDEKSDTLSLPSSPAAGIQTAAPGGEASLGPSISRPSPPRSRAGLTKRSFSEIADSDTEDRGDTERCGEDESASALDFELNSQFLAFGGTDRSDVDMETE